MPTITEAARLLRVSEKTLRKWIAILNDKAGPEHEIRPVQHPYDRRFWTITAEEVQRIAEARAQMPSSPGVPGYGHAGLPMTLAPKRAIVREVPAPVQAHAGAEEGADLPAIPAIPDHYLAQPSLPIAPVDGAFPTRMHASRWLEEHGLPSSTARHWRGWSALPVLSPRAVLTFAMTQRTRGEEYRHRWRLHRCQDSSCVCYELLLS